MKGKDKMYQIKLMAKGVNYIEMWMDKERLDEIGEENIDTEFVVDALKKCISNTFSYQSDARTSEC